MIDATVSQIFEDAFGTPPSLTGFTPGRVNLIGEHTDYNGGRVLPTALTLGVSIAMRPREDDRICIKSDGFDDIALRSLTDTYQDHWADYVVGAVQYARKAGFLKHGADIAITSNLPHGAGLSSSAAIIVGVLKLARDLAQEGASNVDIAILARRVENEFIGVPCGIMDQMAVAIARPYQALALDTETLNYELLNMPEDYHMVVIHSGQRRQLNEGRYKERADECAAAKAVLGRDDICKAELSDLSKLSGAPLKRARHCITEHRRTLAAIEAIKSSDMKTFGALMNESHISMRDDFEMSLPAIDALVEDAVTCGALGARLTGGGFGGCIVACVPKHALQNWADALLEKHPAAYFVA